MGLRDKIRLPPNLGDGGNLKDREKANRSILVFQKSRCIYFRPTTEVEEPVNYYLFLNT